MGDIYYDTYYEYLIGKILVPGFNSEGFNNKKTHFAMVLDVKLNKNTRQSFDITFLFSDGNKLTTAATHEWFREQEFF